jgi:cobaltochelatase CobS
MNMVDIPLNTLPGLDSIPDGVTVPGYPKANDFVPKKDPNYIFRVDDARVLLGHLTSDDPAGMLFVGPRGSGKSSVIHQFHAYTNRPLFFMSGHSSMEFEDAIATREIVDGDTITLNGPLLQAAEMPHSTFLLEEVDRARTTVSVGLNPILDGYDIVNTLDSGRRIKPAEGVRMMFTANTNGQGDVTGDYNSAVVMDTSFLDRVLCHNVWYPSPDEEFHILRQAVGSQIGDDEIRKSITFANDVRYLFTNSEAEASSEAQSLGVGGAIHTTVSTRALIRLWAQMAIYPNVASPIIHALRLVVTNKCTPECAEAIEALAEAQFAGVQ